MTASALHTTYPQATKAHPVSALALVETVTAVEVFTESGLDPILERIATEARTLALDISTDKGRKEIASLAHKIAKSKTALDKLGKDLVAGWKDQAKKVDQERARAWGFLEALQKEIRQPLTEWEDREKTRVAAHEQRLASIENSAIYIATNWLSLSADAMQLQISELETDKTDWQEFSTRAKLALETAISTITAAIAKRQKHDSDQAELARHRKEEEERKQREHEERIKAAAAEKARIEAEEKARKAAEAEAQRVKTEQEKAEKERQRIQREKDTAEAKAKRDAEEAAAREEKINREKAEAEARAAKAEENRIAAEAKAKEDARIAAEKAEREKKAAEEAAAKRERDRIEAERRTQAETKAKREADKVHRTKINNEAMEGLLRAVLVSGEHEFAEVEEEVLARRIVEAIAKGQIPHITISY
jgi:colicin import membrane protein